MDVLVPDASGMTSKASPSARVPCPSSDLNAGWAAVRPTSNQFGVSLRWRSVSREGRR